MVTAIYPGSFDPITLGHLDLIERGNRLFDRLIVCVANNPAKSHLFSLEQRMSLIEDAVSCYPNVEVQAFDALLVKSAKDMDASVILRGLRAVSDFDYEFQMAHMNHQLSPEIETVFMMTGEKDFYLSSALVREVASLGGNIESFVPSHVATALNERLAKK